MLVKAPVPSANQSDSRTQVSTLVVLLVTGCVTEANPGISPPNDALFFPVSATLDPRTNTEPGALCDAEDPCDPGARCTHGVCREESRWLFVTNANSDIRYNAGTLATVNLTRFLDAALHQPVLDPDAELDPADTRRACRRVPAMPQMVECTEEPFIERDATVYMGNFASMITGWHRPLGASAPDSADTPATERSLLLAAVRGDPSVTYFELTGGHGADDPPHLDCGQGKGDTCASSHKLTHLRNDPDQPRLHQEPVFVSVSDPAEGRPLAYVTHVGTPALTLISLEGMLHGAADPAIIDQAPLMTFNEVPLPGGYGLAERPCLATEDSNCGRPLIYSSFRHSRHIAVFSPIRVGKDENAAGPDCVGPDEIGVAGGVLCDERAIREQIFFAGGLTPPSSGGISFARPRLGMIAFSENGDSLYVAQTEPSSLIRIDTSLGSEGRPRNIPAGEVEVCPSPTALALYEDGSDRLGLVTCLQQMFVVDLTTMQLIAAIRLSALPFHMTVDYAREYVYAVNTLDATISVVDFSRDRPTRLTQVARLGIVDPYND
ncbi:MAG: hypothetical protein V3V08_25525 [Nannocystaceae bacterium]